MLKRLAIGLIKGLVIGGAIGAGLTYGLHWSVPANAWVAGLLLAMGAAGTTGVFAGKPPWKEGAWLEALLKGGVGAGVGALLYWLGSTYAGFIELPLPSADGGPWTSLPVVFLPAIAGVYGSLVELDNTGDDSEGGTKGGTKGSAPPRTRVAVDDGAYDATEHATSTKAAKRRA